MSAPERDYAEMLAHFDILAEVSDDDKHKMLEYAREHCPVARTDQNGGFWMVTSFEHVREALMDWRTFSSTKASIFENNIRTPPFDYDPPIQTAARKLLNPLFSRAALTPMIPRMREVANSLIDKWVDQGTVEIVDGYADPFVSLVLVDLVFNDMSEEDLNWARDIAHRQSHAPTPQVYIDLFDISAKYLANARKKGVNRDGVVKRLLEGTFDGRPLTEEEQVGVLAILILGGLDTTRGAITSIAYRVASNPGLEKRLRDPDWIRRDMDEFLRLDSPVAALARVATKDTTLGGVRIKAGERLQIRYDSANRDASKFHDPYTIVLDEPRTGHAAFGFGIHRCLGSNLARLQIEVAFDELLKRVKDLRLSPGFVPHWMAGPANAIEAVQLDFDRAAD